MAIGLQLYSMRDCADQIALLGELPSMGITQVEGYGGVYGDPNAYRAAMDENGITMPSGHIAIEDMERDFDSTVALAKTLGMRHVFAPYLQEQDRPTTSAEYVDLAHRLAAAAQKFSDLGLTMGWHNHDFEFLALADGAIPMDILLQEAPEMTWEADLAWIVRGGHDPLTYVEKYGSRLTSIHVKDIAADGSNLDQDGWADLGEGTLDWAALLQACRSQSADLIYALEHDKPADPMAYAKRSAAAFKTLWESTHG